MTDADMPQMVTTERHGDVATIRIDNSPVNAAGIALRRGVIAALDALEAEDGVKAIGLYCAGRTFVAGADIREFGKPREEPSLQDVVSPARRLAHPGGGRAALHRARRRARDRARVPSARGAWRAARWACRR